MAQFDPTWTYGRSKLFGSSGATVTNGEDVWDYGLDDLYHEFVAAGVGVTLPIINLNDIHSTIFGGQVVR